MGKNTITDILKFVVSIAICQCAGFIGSLFTTPAIPTWYASLAKPSFMPPNGVFAPVWITLYFLMGISAFLVWRRGMGDHRVRRALVLFGAQLFLNVLWSALFFGLRSPLAGLIDISILWVAILLTILYFIRIAITPGVLLIPYILWVSFAGALNVSIWMSN